MRSRRTSFSIWMTGQIGRMAGLPLLLVLCAMPVGRAVRAEQPAEFRGLWVVRHDLATRREACDAPAACWLQGRYGHNSCR